MLAHHLSLGITGEHRARFVSLMSLAADDAKLPDDLEFRSVLLAYLEWGTRIAMYNSQADPDVRPTVLKKLTVPGKGDFYFECQMLGIAESGQQLVTYCSEPESAVREALRQFAPRNIEAEAPHRSKAVSSPLCREVSDEPDFEAQSAILTD